MRNVTVVVLARYQDIFEGFKRGINEFEPSVRKILVKDGDNIFPGIGMENWTVIQAPAPFNFSRNVNLGWAAAGDDDVLHCGDDVRFSSPVIAKLQEVAYSDPTIAVSVPELGGQSPFAIGLFKREMLNQVGWMDEEYTGYGVDDNDFCHRFGLAGWRTQPTTEVKVEHSAASTYYRRQAEGAVNMGESCEQNWKRFNQKWGKPSEGPDRWLKEGHE